MRWPTESRSLIIGFSELAIKYIAADWIMNLKKPLNIYRDFLKSEDKLINEKSDSLSKIIIRYFTPYRIMKFIFCIFGTAVGILTIMLC